MMLRDLTAGIPGAHLISRGPGADIDRVAYRSDDAAPGAIFACLPGARVDGHDYAAQAVAAGASALIVERELPVAVDQILVPDARLAMALAAVQLEGDPSSHMRVVGITGTNGKTTSAFLMRAVLEASGADCGLIGTIEARVGGEVVPVSHTTPESVDLQHLLARMRAAGDTACAIEVSSHALEQKRVAGLTFAAAMFTNLTRDHMDYHETEEDYFLAKRKLFVRPAFEGGSPPGTVNIDDPFGRRLADELGVLTYAVDDLSADVRPTDLRMSRGGFSAVMQTPRGRFAVRSRMRGLFNVANVTGVIAVAELLGLPHERTAAGISGINGVPGRFEPVDAGQPFEVLVDYAHTPDSLQNVLSEGRKLVPDGSRLIVVVGCGGDRDRGKRPQMGEIARRLADVTVITSDNPRTEDPDAIIGEIVAGATVGQSDLIVEPDRRDAIKMAIERAGDGDVVIIAGKGHERGQERDGVITPFDDREVARDVLGGVL
jgi:UDP-N-acetylmuramoyl-L-alanyl-D-glutamate--2,6-diaminopimelate ligase